MSFKEKSTVLMLLIYAAVYGNYALNTWAALDATPATDIDYQGTMLWMVGALVVLAVVGNILIAALSPETADQIDERDRAIERLADQWAGYVLGGFCLFGMALAMREQAHFYIAHTLLAGLVVAEMSKSAIMLWQYRRGY